MAMQVCSGAMMKCSFGMAPSSLSVLVPTVKAGGQPAANIMDHVPNSNIAPFGMCQSMANPQVAAATAAAMGTLTPQPCIPMTTAPWTPGVPTVKIRGQPTLNDSSKLMCNWAGVIEITFAGQTVVKVP